MGAQHRIKIDDGWRVRAKRLMLTESLLQRDLALEIGVARSTLNQWLNGRSEPNLFHIVVFARRLGVTVDWLLTGKEKE